MDNTLLPCQHIYKKYRDEAKRETVFELHFPDSFVSKCKNYKFSVLLELASAMAEPEDFIQ